MSVLRSVTLLAGSVVAVALASYLAVLVIGI